ncbi:hypothetical protein JNUCC0626_23720 [Lentzea sp. JNUCC 0626]|uniref:hypothetical protein n=1 Tax=Lentzea sp. JNUCC 0626 TaxID=3367513 RepID=UPI0037491D23
MNDVLQPVKITISGRVSFEEEISLSQAAYIIAYIGSSDPTAGSPPVIPHAAAPTAITAAPSVNSTKMISALSSDAPSNPREALDTSGAKTNAEKIVAFALYIAQEGDKDTFTPNDIKPMFKRARESAPQNFARDLAVAIQSGWIVESDEKNEYYVAAKASAALEVGFEGIRKSRGSNGTKKRQSGGSSSRNGKPSRKSINTVPEVFKDVETIESAIDGVVDYHKLTKQIDRFLWAVYAAKLLGVPSVKNQDIVWLTDKLGDGIPTGNIAKNYQHLSKSNYVNKSLQDGSIRITPRGEEYLKSLEP